MGQGSVAEGQSGGGSTEMGQGSVAEGQSGGGSTEMGQGSAAEGQSGGGGKRGRKRTRNPDNWENMWRNKEKIQEKIMSGTEVSCIGKKMKKGCGEGCRYKCHKNVSADNREKLFDLYWGLGDITLQRQFLLKYAHSKPTKQQSNKKKLQVRAGVHVPYLIHCQLAQKKILPSHI